VADASAAAPSIGELLGLATRPDWVAEHPEAYLEDGVRRGAEDAGLTVAATTTSPAGAFVVTLLHDAAMSRREVRVAAWYVIGAVAETLTHVVEESGTGTVQFRVVTGTRETDAGFATHGHYLILELAPRPTD
jgi:hypothetical protein